MSLNLQQLKAVITADDRDYQRGMQRVERRGQEAARNVKRSFEGMAIKAPSMGGGFLSGVMSGAGGNLVTDMLKGVASGFTAVQRAGIDYNRTLETSTLAFETLIGSAGEAKKHIEALEKQAIASPFETSDLVSASLQLQAFGSDAKQVLKDLPAIGDAASVAAAGAGNFAEALQGTVLALGQMRSAGKLSLEEINQLTTRGVAALDILERKTGRTKAQIRKDIEAGRVSGAGAANLLVEGFREAYGGTAERLGGTVAGKESTLADKFKQRAAADKQAFEAYRQSLDIMIAGLDSETAKKVSSKVDSIVGDNIQFFTELLSGKITAEEFGKNLIPAAKLAVKDFGEVVTGGLKSAWEATSGIVSGVAKSAGEAMGGASIEGAKKMLGIESPSRVFMELGALSAEGFKVGLTNNDAPEKAADEIVNRLIDRTSEGMKKWGKAIEAAGGEEFLKAVEAMAGRLGQDPNKLMNIMAFESGLNPAKKNPRSTATGLIQFMRDTATGLGTTVEDLKKMGAIEQLDYVEKYFAKYRNTLRAFASQEELYTTVLSGKPRRADSILFRKGTQAYTANRELDKDKSGEITGAEATAHVFKQGFLATTEKLTPPLQQLVAPVTSIAKLLASAPGLPAMRAGAYDPALAIRGLDGPQAKPFSAAQQMMRGGEIITDVVGQLDRVPFAEASKELGRLDLSTTRARAALGAMNEQAALSPPLLNETAKALEKVSNGGKRALDEYFGQASDGERWKKFGQRFGDSFDQSLGEILNDPANWKDALRGFASNFFNDLFSSLQQQLLTRATGKASFGAIIGDVIGSFLGGFLGGGGGVKLPSGGGALKIPALNINPFLGVPGLAAGGPVKSGKTYLVGEKGPELFTAQQSGQIIPNHKLEGEKKKKGIADFLFPLKASPFPLLGDVFFPKAFRNARALAPLAALGLAALGPVGLVALPAFGGLFPKLFGGKREAGGPVSAGLTYLVGERGPELYQPSASALAHAGGSVSNHTRVENKTVNVVNHFHISAPQGKVSQESQHQIASKLGAAIMHALKRDG